MSHGKLFRSWGAATANAQSWKEYEFSETGGSGESTLCSWIIYWKWPLIRESP